MKYHSVQCVSILFLMATCFASCANQRSAAPSSTAFGALVVPAAFSPDNDGIDDTWHIANLKAAADIFVYTRYGELVYRSRGQYVPWNGTYKGKEVPAGRYYYIIDIRRGLRNPDGWVTLKR